MLKRYIIERKVSGVGKSSAQELAQMAEKSNDVLNSLGPKIQWLQSYITDDKIYCEYLAENEEVVREHARLGGFPADSVLVVKNVIDPTTQDEGAADFRPPSSSYEQEKFL